MNYTPVLALTIDTETQLRLLEARHAEDYFLLIDRNRDHLRPWMGWLDEETSPETTRNYIKFRLQRFAGGEALPLAIWYQNNLVGSISLNTINWGTRKAEIGYWLDASTQGRGMMTKACHALIAYAFDEYGLNKIEIHCAPGNRRSRAIPERLGFTQEGIIRQNEWIYDHYVDHVIYGMLASEWEK